MASRRFSLATSDTSSLSSSWWSATLPDSTRGSAMPLDAEPSNNRSVQREENLDVFRTSRDQESLEPKGSVGESGPDPHLSVVCSFPAQPSRQRKQRGPYRPLGTKCISLLQATNIIEA